MIMVFEDRRTASHPGDLAELENRYGAARACDGVCRPHHLLRHISKERQTRYWLCGFLYYCRNNLYLEFQILLHVNGALCLACTT